MRTVRTDTNRRFAGQDSGPRQSGFDPPECRSRRNPAGILQSGNGGSMSPRVLRAGMGAHFLLEVFEDVSLEKLIETAKIPVIATTPYTKKTIYDFDLNRPVAWLLGHEGRGVDERLMVMASDKLVIPHMGAMESLNVAACAAVCFFEQVRQCR